MRPLFLANALGMCSWAGDGREAPVCCMDLGGIDDLLEAWADGAFGEQVELGVRLVTSIAHHLSPAHELSAHELDSGARRGAA